MLRQWFLFNQFSSNSRYDGVWDMKPTCRTFPWLNVVPQWWRNHVHADLEQGGFIKFLTRGLIKVSCCIAWQKLTSCGQNFSPENPKKFIDLAVACHLRTLTIFAVCCMTRSNDQATVWISRLAGRLSTSALLPLTLPTQWFIRYLKSSRKPKREFSRNACDEQSKEEFSFWEKGTATSASRNISGILCSLHVHTNTRKTSCCHDLVSVSRSQYSTLPLVLINFKVGAKKVRSPCRSLLALSATRKKVDGIRSGWPIPGRPPFTLLRNSNICFTHKKHCRTSIQHGIQGIRIPYWCTG